MLVSGKHSHDERCHLRLLTEQVYKIIIVDKRYDKALQKSLGRERNENAELEAKLAELEPQDKKAEVEGSGEDQAV